MSKSIFSQEELKFNRLNLDFIKKTDLKVIYEVLMAEPQSRTIADINTLIKIFLNIEPIKLINNLSIIYHLCSTMFLAKFKEKTFMYQKLEDSECLYLVLTGRIGLYKRSNNVEDDEEIVFLAEGNCFGTIYNWKEQFVPLTFEQTLVAIIPKRQINRITVIVAQERQNLYRIIKQAKVFSEVATEQILKYASNYFILNRVPFKTYIIKQGETPKGLFFLLKGSAKKVVEFGENSNQKLSTNSYCAGDFFPKQNLSEPLIFSIISESPCQIVTIPKKALKILKYCYEVGESSLKTKQYYHQQVTKEENWRQFKQQILHEVVNRMGKKNNK